MFQLPDETTQNPMGTTAKPGLDPKTKQMMSMMLAQQALGAVGTMARPGQMTRTRPGMDMYGNPMGMLGY